MQLVGLEVEGSFREVQLHDADFEVLPGVRFGRADQLLSPAHWVVRCMVAPESSRNFENRYSSLAEEVGFCLLGGYGITAEIATAYFRLLQQKGVFSERQAPDSDSIYDLLSSPLDIAGQMRRYRFPKQRASRIQNALAQLHEISRPIGSPKNLRAELQKLQGIGPKTASWIVRNWLGADDVAILDIHILRAGWAISLFDRSARLPDDYEFLENKFLAFAHNIGVRASVLDAVIWSDMRTYGSQLLRVLDRRPNIVV